MRERRRIALRLFVCVYLMLQKELLTFLLVIGVLFLQLIFNILSDLEMLRFMLDIVQKAKAFFDHVHSGEPTFADVSPNLGS